MGWSQAEVAKRSGVARPTVARIEALMMQPRLDTVGKLKKAFLEGGLQILDGQPPGGFSLIISEPVLQALWQGQLKKKENDTPSSATDTG